MLSTRDPLQTKGHIQTESEGLEKRYFTESCSAASALGQLLGTLFSITVYANNKANV